MFTNSTNFRDLARRPKEVIAEVKKNKKAKVIVGKNKEPQAVIVSLDDYEELKNARAKKGAQEMLRFIRNHEEDLKRLPKDLRQKANQILYSK